MCAEISDQHTGVRQSFFAPCSARDRSRLRRRCVSRRSGAGKSDAQFSRDRTAAGKSAECLPQSCAAGSEKRADIANGIRLRSNALIGARLRYDISPAIPRSVAETATSSAACFHLRIRVLHSSGPHCRRLISRCHRSRGLLSPDRKSDRCHRHICHLARAISFSTH